MGQRTTAASRSDDGAATIEPDDEPEEHAEPRSGRAVRADAACSPPFRWPYRRRASEGPVARLREEIGGEQWRIASGSMGRLVRQPRHTPCAPRRSEPSSPWPPGPRSSRWPAGCRTCRRCRSRCWPTPRGGSCTSAVPQALQYGSGQGDVTLREQILEVIAEVGDQRPPRRHRRDDRLADGPRPRHPGLLRSRRRRPGRGAVLRRAPSGSSAPMSATSFTWPWTSEGLVPAGARGGHRVRRALRASGSS